MSDLEKRLHDASVLLNSQRGPYLGDGINKNIHAYNLAKGIDELLGKYSEIEYIIESLSK